MFDNECDQLVTGPQLLEIVFIKDARPCLRSLDRMRKMKRIPFVRLGRRIFYSPKKVRQALGL
jgi:hypothetical protein